MIELVLNSGLDMYFGGKFGNDGVSIIKGFVDYIKEIRLYSNSAQTIGHPAYEYISEEAVAQSLKS